MAGINKGSSNIPEVHPFKGTFDGDGHTLTCHYNSLDKWTGAIIAPFRYVSNATIKNLKTAGAITTDAMCAAGIVGDATGSLNLTNCCSSVNISSTRPDIAETSTSVAACSTVRLYFSPQKVILNIPTSTVLHSVAESSE